jgi:hypothetical protein
VRRVNFQAFEHGPSFVEYRGTTPGAGNLYGIRWPATYPASARLGVLRWVGGEDVVVPTLFSAWIPLAVTRRFRFWARGPQTLAVRAILPADIDTAKLAREGTQPTAVWVRAVTNGAETVVPNWTQGGAQ